MAYSPARKPWTRDELLLAINLYCKTQFGRIHIHSPEIIELAKYLGRTPGSVSYKLANFASIDPSLDRKGAANVSKLDRVVWQEFFADWDKMAFESEQNYLQIKGETACFDELSGGLLPEGKDRESVVRSRVNQGFFRKMVLSSYDFCCCITGLPITELLVASHIIPWAKDSKNRLNPQNGLCLNSLHDKAFDQGFITIDDSYRVLVSDEINSLDDKSVKIISAYHKEEINLPRRFRPSQEFLRYHRENVFRL
jgi:putative restriction endonuclease